MGQNPCSVTSTLPFGCLVPTGASPALSGDVSASWPEPCCIPLRVQSQAGVKIQAGWLAAPAASVLCLQPAAVLIGPWVGLRVGMGGLRSVFASLPAPAAWPQLASLLLSLWIVTSCRGM